MRSCGIAGRWALKPTIAASRIALNSNARSGVWRGHAMRSRSLEHHRAISMILRTKRIRFMSTQDDNKAVVGRWFTEFWGKDVNRGRRRDRGFRHALEIFAARLSPRTTRTSDALAAFVILAAIQFAIKRLARM
jgi:hypothetical protein